MSWQIAVALYMVVLVALLVFGVAIGSVMGLVGILGVTLASGTQLWSTLGDIVWNTTNSFTLVAVPLFVLMSDLNLVNSLPGIFLPFAAQAFGVFLMRQFIQGIPNELLEAARIDGAGEFAIFWRVVLPLLGAPLATLGILIFLGSWNNFLWPLIIATSDQTYTLPVAVGVFSIGQNAIDYGLLMAGSVVLIAPVLTLFLLLQRFVQQGIATTGLKG